MLQFSRVSALSSQITNSSSDEGSKVKMEGVSKVKTQGVDKAQM